MVMVTTFLLAFLQLAHRKQGGELDHIKGGVIMMVNIKWVGSSRSPPEVIVMIYAFFFMLLQPT
jgi:hypothetical protein